MESGSISHSCSQSSDIEPPGKNMQFSQNRKTNTGFIFLPSGIEKFTYIV